MDWLQHMNATLIAEIDSAEEFAAVSREWLTGALAEIFPSLYEGLLTRPAVTLPPSDGLAPWGKPGQVLGMLDIGRDDPVAGRRRTLYSDRAWERFLARLGEHPLSATVTIVPLDDQGHPLHKHWAYVTVRRDELYPAWTTVTFTAPAEYADWPGSPEMQDSWAGFVRRQATRAGACAGLITDDIGAGMFALERATDSWTWIPDSCKLLRGYSWVTIVAAKLAGRLGGAEALRASGAFYEVSELRDGALWLRATPALNEFTGERVRMVFDALAPVLLPGVARFDENEYRMVRGVDAANHR